ncbi:23S rRNA (guanine(745)-N(1))-methyltransferase [Pseudoalteromonas denitrificans]|uniref:23S rRNA (Guanine745-N1)-methyltransferase n=1 Tax=Pseudoalteromonas denitrificans DSM 6059 TaxID=1123010 RepID=A0A1I1L2D0_9GAMM|nr:23S rRNA (guanine(745)-N(1))-methyltransferase [Pseudoalteromonas denitrificans]SFC63770.1 23S rRNA (guanine745-N1)-methyltransferase [Pseudoalteromonas denitrificans DSM 6059]
MSLAYICPICTQNLSLNNKTLSCSNNHSFDFAKEGYVNLLPVQHKKSKDPGDNIAMVQARRQFLSQGHYCFLQNAVADKLKSVGPDKTVIDLGCGEGFYTQALQKSAPTCTVYGVDISKPAIKYAAKRYPDCHFSVASIAQAPFNDLKADVIVSIFAPLFDTELSRLCKDKLIVASPGPRHLFELKKQIYQDVNLHTPVDCPQGFESYSEETLTRTVVLDIPTAKNLVMMTPFAWKFRPEHWQDLEQKENIEVTLEFYLSIFKKII